MLGTRITCDTNQRWTQILMQVDEYSSFCLFSIYSIYIFCFLLFECRCLINWMHEYIFLQIYKHSSSFKLIISIKKTLAPIEPSV